MAILYQCVLERENGQTVAAYSGYAGEITPVGGVFGATDFEAWHSASAYACEPLREVCTRLNSCSGNTVSSVGEFMYTDDVTLICDIVLVDCNGDCVSFALC